MCIVLRDKYRRCSLISGVTLGAEAPSQDFCDPFTGGNRYVPGSSRGISIDVAQNGNTSPGEVSDPFIHILSKLT